MHRIAPSILSADFARLGDEVRAVEASGVDQIHVDVMDGHFVPNISMGPLVVRALRPVTKLPLDVHLMITDPGRYLDAFIDAGADHISVHVESEGDPAGLIARLHARGIGAGVVLNPETPVERVLPFVPLADLILVMTVHPGFGGQRFLAENLAKVRAIRDAERRSSRARPLDVQVDGGVDRSTLAACADAGANVFVAGSAIFGARDGAVPDPARSVRELREVLAGASAPEGL